MKTIVTFFLRFVFKGLIICPLNFTECIEINIIMVGAIEKSEWSFIDTSLVPLICPILTIVRIYQTNSVLFTTIIILFTILIRGGFN